MADKILPVDYAHMQENSIAGGKNAIGAAIRTVAGLVGKAAENVAKDYKPQGVGAKMASNASKEESFSYDSRSLPKAQVKDIKAQNAAAKTNVSKDLAAVERGKASAATAKQNIQNKIGDAYDAGRSTGHSQGLKNAVGALGGVRKLPPVPQPKKK
jgi:hypothetical protein